VIGGSTVREAARASGWSARMLRYIEQAGLVVPARSRSGYRVYDEAEVIRLRQLRQLLAAHGVSLDDVGFALRMRRDRPLRDAVAAWLDAGAAAGPSQHDDIAPTDWLRWEQRKQQRLLAVA
jgi:MerR family transcriptional regulator, copper efflux regulator